MIAVIDNPDIDTLEAEIPVRTPTRNGRNRRSTVRAVVVAVAVALLGLGLTSFAAATAQQRLDSERSRELDDRADRATQDVRLRLEAYSATLFGLRSLFDASEFVSASEFAVYVGSTSILERLPGVQALEWASVVGTASLSSYEAAVRNDPDRATLAYPEFRVHPRSDAGDHFVVDYIVPVSGNEAAFGFDLGSNPARRAAVERARDTGQPVATAPITLVQESGDQRAFLLLVPVYDSPEPGSQEDRRATFAGLVLAVFRVGDLLGGVVDPDLVTLRVADVGSVDQKGSATPEAIFSSSTPSSGAGSHARTRELDVAGRRWVLEIGGVGMGSGPGATPWIVGLVGVIATSLAALLVWKLASRHDRATIRLHALLSDVLDASSEATLVVDQSGRVVMFNAAAEVLTGRERTEMIGAPSSILGPRGVGELQNQDDARFLEKPESWTGTSASTMFSRRDGSILPVRVSVSRFDRGGEPLFQLVMRDRREEEHEHARRLQAQKLEAVGSLASGVAHELNTPIQFIGDNMRFLGDAFAELSAGLTSAASPSSFAPGAEPAPAPSVPDDDLEYLLEEIPLAIAQTLEGVDKVATIVRAMKAFGHPDTSAQLPVDINDALQNTMTVAGNTLSDVADVDTAFGDLPLVMCHPGDLNQVFLNVLLNAADAIETRVDGSGQRGTITVTTSMVAGHAVISIADTGCGISSEVRDRIFDPFFSTKEVGKGTGQGLAIGRSMVERHGGTVEFESEPDVGTTFHIRIPVTGNETTGDGGPE